MAGRHGASSSQALTAVIEQLRVWTPGCDAEAHVLAENAFTPTFG